MMKEHFERSCSQGETDPFLCIQVVHRQHFSGENCKIARSDTFLFEKLTDFLITRVVGSMRFGQRLVKNALHFEI